jgi:mono/diheme cytochrome c family protein
MKRFDPEMPSIRRACLFRTIPATLALFGFVAACAPEATPPSGEALYNRYCASCHGADAKGDGPVAASLRIPPPDLTMLAQRAGGRFDEAAVMGAIDGRRIIAGHGTREMPVWGAVFEQELKDSTYPGYTGMLRSRTLSDYVRTLQR